MEQEEVIEFLKDKWVKIYQVYDMLDDSFKEYKEIEKQLEALETVLILLSK